ncbi:MAG: hypothetical protein EYC62_09080 [Alphaproteobacteria bacterium]|nr:MAG: hypothetical protein EYC62_09080 [Alphaproteobacteria bacterium]
MRIVLQKEITLPLREGQKCGSIFGVGTSAYPINRIYNIYHRIPTPNPPMFAQAATPTLAHGGFDPPSRGG